MHFNFFVPLFQNFFFCLLKHNFAHSSDTVFIIWFLCICAVALSSVEWLVSKFLLSFPSHGGDSSLTYSTFHSSRCVFCLSHMTLSRLALGFCTWLLLCLGFLLWHSVSTPFTSSPLNSSSNYFLPGSFTLRLWAMPLQWTGIIEYSMYLWEYVVKSAYVTDQKAEVQSGSPELCRLEACVRIGPRWFWRPCRFLAPAISQHGYFLFGLMSFFFFHVCTFYPPHLFYKFLENGDHTCWLLLFVFHYSP